MVWARMLLAFYILCKTGRCLVMLSEMKKTAVVTGGNAGMGKATVAALADQGFTVVMLCRSRQRGEAALRDLSGVSGRDIRLMLCDLGSMADIRRFADEFRST